MSNRARPLRLHEEVLLLGLRNQAGALTLGVPYRGALGGAILAELLLAGRVAVGEGRRPPVSVTSTEPLGDEILDEALHKVAARPATASACVRRLGRLRDLVPRTAGSLCRRRILRERECTVLLVFRRRVYPQINPRPRRRLLECVRRAVFTETRSVAPRTVLLVAVARSAGLLRVAFPGRDLGARKRRLDRLVKGRIMGQAPRQDAEAARAAAVTITTIMPAAMAGR